MANIVSNTPRNHPEPPTNSSIPALFTAFLSTLPQLIADERDLAGYSGQDPAVDTWIAAADASLARTKRACEAVLAAIPLDLGDRRLRRVTCLFAGVIETSDPEVVAVLRSHAKLRRWGYLLPSHVAGACKTNRRITMALDALEIWLSLEDAFDARAETWAQPDPAFDGDGLPF